MPATRRATSMTLDAALLDEARALGVNLSRAAEEGILLQVRAERARRWKEDNAEAIADYNRWIEENGIPNMGIRIV
ncbi:type II toxin-antitoxin system CcdA family antitoxin [Tabrizicola sp.]|uniref:type II toxin-antitoxin system CcdA family antitoxin n=1 Tax=Tabrizicola sp. TaxID=2005166 RepID=UPI0035B23C2E